MCHALGNLCTSSWHICLLCFPSWTRNWKFFFHVPRCPGVRSTKLKTAGSNYPLVFTNSSGIKVTCAHFLWLCSLRPCRWLHSGRHPALLGRQWECCPGDREASHPSVQLPGKDDQYQRGVFLHRWVWPPPLLSLVLLYARALLVTSAFDLYNLFCLLSIPFLFWTPCKTPFRKSQRLTFC